MPLRSFVRHNARPILAIVGGLLALTVVAFATLWIVQAGEVLPNTTLAGIEVGGMDEAQVREEVEPEVTRRETDTVTFSFDDEEYGLEPREVGYRIDVDASVEAVLSRGRESLFSDLVERVRAYRTPATYELVESPDATALQGWVDDLADELDQEELRGGVTIEVDPVSVVQEPSQGRVTVDREEMLELARGSLLSQGSDRYELPAETTLQPIPTPVIEATAEQARQALAEPLLLRSGDEELELAPADLAGLIEVVEVGTTPGNIDLELEVTPERVDETIGEVASGRFDVDPTPAAYSASRTPPARFDAQNDATYRPVSASVEVVAGRVGREFDPEMAAEQLTGLVRDANREAELRMAEVHAEFSNEDAEELRPTHAIGTFTTYHQAGQTRVDNIQLLADVIDGALVLPGERFSINEISGARTCEKGYEPAGTIIQGELVDTCGGGTSQFGTTTFNAAFFAGVQLDQWKAHSWYISRYPIGREATLSYPQLDVKFTNNTPGAVLVKTSHTATSVTVTLYGVPRAEAVSARHGDRTRPRTFETENRTTSELEEGQARVLQSGSNGFTIQVTRTIDLVEGGTEERTITTTYVPQTRIVERGTRPPDDEDD
ncbi:MAG: VanW family protein [Nitriliruptoraceae bacterium]